MKSCWVDGGLILGSIANEAFVAIESDMRRSDAITLVVRNDFDASTTSETTTVRPQHVRVHVAVINARVSMSCAKGQAHVKDKALAHWQDVKGKGAGDGGCLLFVRGRPIRTTSKLWRN